MSLRQLGGSQAFGAPGITYAALRRPPRATHLAVYVYPVPNDEWPIPAGYGTRSHCVLQFMDQREPVPGGAFPLAVGQIIGEIDFTTSTELYGQPIRLPSDCGSVGVINGNAVGSTAIVRGRAFWFEERAD